MMDKDSPLMKKAEARGIQFANTRGLGNSTIAGQAAQSAMLDQIVPMASQQAQINFSGQQTNRQGAESMLNSAFQAYEASKQSILANPDLPAAERTKLLANAEKFMQQKINFTENLYRQDFNWPADRWT
jgi:hypothetical protein